MCSKCIQTKTCGKMQVCFLINRCTIVLQTTIAFKGIKYYCFTNYNCAKGTKVLLHCKVSSKEPNTIAL